LIRDWSAGPGVIVLGGYDKAPDVVWVALMPLGESDQSCSAKVTTLARPE
jgi:hypothetical protein